MFSEREKSLHKKETYYKKKKEKKKAFSIYIASEKAGGLWWAQVNIAKEQ